MPLPAPLPCFGMGSSVNEPALVADLQFQPGQTDIVECPAATVNRRVASSNLARGRRYVAVEAKKNGTAFTFPDTPARTLKLNGTLVTNKQIREAVEQVRGYCDDAVIRYAIASNGYAWIVFRVIREDMPWREGNARIFGSLEYIEQNFTDFWNLLSFRAIERGSLDDEFTTNLSLR
jgi:hypothetical protein